MTESQNNALKLLASKRGGLLILQYCTPEDFKRFRLSLDDAIQALNELERQGLAGSIYERLDGLIFTLSKDGREFLSQKGYQFDRTQVESTAKLFGELQCNIQIQ